jgi:hypothetical protein
MRISPAEAASYAGSAASIGAPLTLSDVGVLVGILTALATFGINAYFRWRDDQRKQRESDARLHEMEEHGG